MSARGPAKALLAAMYDAAGREWTAEEAADVAHGGNVDACRQVLLRAVARGELEKVRHGVYTTAESIAEEACDLFGLVQP